jgi:aminoglycoside phosphotransferase
MYGTHNSLRGPEVPCEPPRMPDSISALVQGGAFVEICRTYNAPSRVYRITRTGASTLYLKIGANLRDEFYRLLWLDTKLTVPQVELFAEQDGIGFLLLGELPGRPADLWEWGKEAGRLVSILGEAVRTIHHVDSSGCPFDASTSRLLAHAQHVVEGGHVHPSEFSQAYRHLTAAEVLNHTLCLRPLDIPAVFTHGDCCLPNIIITSEGQFGFIDVGMAGVGDPWRDLALMGRSLHRNLGGQWIERFFDGYGTEIDPRRMEFFAYLDQLIMARGPILDIFPSSGNNTLPTQGSLC